MRREPRSEPAGDLVQAWEAGKAETATPWRPYQGQTLTPLYGGGVKAGEVDKELPVRASAIRGQLRFWWRLLQPRMPAPVLFAEETALWGGIGGEGPTASRVRVRVRHTSAVTLAPAFVYEKRLDGTYPTAPKVGVGMNAYALFPAQGKRHEANHHLIEQAPGELAKPGITFTLEVACPADRWPEVETALRWWASFGGLGARTRRGLGAVEFADLPPVTAAEVTQAGGRLVLRKARDNAVGAWQEAVERLRAFRQGEGVGRNPGKEHNRPGRSRWPEPDMIRRLTNRWDGDHAPSHPVRDLYPRAAFGLPIVFHFQSAKDPEQLILEPHDEAYDRLASPLVLRPYRSGPGKYQPAALLIPGWEQALATDLRFKGTPHQMLTTWPGQGAQGAEQARQIPPLAQQAPASDPLSAFLAFFVKEQS